MNIDTTQLENILIPRMSLDTDLDKFELPNTNIPNPTLVFLSKPDESWYVYVAIIVTAMAMVTSVTIYCKCKRKLCFSVRGRHSIHRESENRTKESESEEQIKLVEQIPKYCEMTLENLGFCKEIVTLQKGKKYLSKKSLE